MCLKKCDLLQGTGKRVKVSPFQHEEKELLSEKMGSNHWPEFLPGENLGALRSLALNSISLEWAEPVPRARPTAPYTNRPPQRTWLQRTFLPKKHFLLKDVWIICSWIAFELQNTPSWEWQWKWLCVVLFYATARVCYNMNTGLTPCQLENFNLCLQTLSNSTVFPLTSSCFTGLLHSQVWIW